MPNLRLYYKSDYKIRETFTTQAGTTIDPRNFNFKFVFIAGKENTFTCSHTIGAADEWVNCVYDSENNAVLCMLDNHNLLPGLLKRELTIEEPDSDFPDNKLDYITFKAYEIELIDTTDGDSLYDIYDEEIVIAVVNAVDIANVIHSATEDNNITDSSEFEYTKTGTSLLKTTWLNIIAKLRAVFNLEYEPKKSTGENYVSDAELEVLQNTSGENTGDETAESIIDKIGTDGQIKSDYLPSYVDDVIEGYYFEAAFYSDSAHTELITAEQGKIYVDIPTNFSYRYSGSAYINISNPLDYSTNIEADKLSTTKISAIKTFYDWAVGKFIDLSKIVTSWSATPTHDNIPSEKLVKDSLDLKADITPANGSTSALRALFIARSWNRATSGGAERYELTYNAISGYYEMYGITNLTESDVLEIYNASLPLASNATTTGVVTMEGVFAYRTARTHFPFAYFAGYHQGAFRYFAQGNVKFEKFIFEGFYGVLAVGNAVGMFYGCTLLNEVRTINLQYITDAALVGNMFLGCSSLVTCSVKNIKVSLSFGSSPLLSLASLQYLVTNRANGTSTITITVHADVWAKLNDSGNYPEWNALFVTAGANYIAFAYV